MLRASHLPWSRKLSKPWRSKAKRRWPATLQAPLAPMCCPLCFSCFLLQRVLRLWHLLHTEDPVFLGPAKPILSFQSPRYLCSPRVARHPGQLISGGKWLLSCAFLSKSSAQGLSSCQLAESRAQSRGCAESRHLRKSKLIKWRRILKPMKFTKAPLLVTLMTGRSLDL